MYILRCMCTCAIHVHVIVSENAGCMADLVGPKPSLTKCLSAYVCLMLALVLSPQTKCTYLS